MINNIDFENINGASKMSNYFRKSNQEKKQTTDTINEEKKIKSDNFTRSNRGKYNIAIAILEKAIIGWHQNYFVLWWYQ